MKYYRKKKFFVYYELRDTSSNSIFKSGNLILKTSKKYLKNKIPTVIEKKIKSMGVGDQDRILITPENGYGFYNKKLIKRLPKEQFLNTNIKIGDTLLKKDKDNNISLANVMGIDNDCIVVDTNHELAGKSFFCKLKIIKIK